MSPDVTIILPCLNEGHRLGSTLETIAAWFDAPPEIIVVDDGSGDETVERARTYAAAEAHVRVHALDRHRGKGAALRAAIPFATRGRVLFMDADLAFDRQSVDAVLDGLGDADMAVGNRRHRDSRYLVPVRLFGFLYRRHIVGQVFNLLVRALFPVGMRDTQCGLKAFRREALQRLAASLSIDGFALDVEMIVVARALGLRIAEVPVQVTYRSAMSSVRLLQTGAAVGRDLARIALRRAAGRYTPARVRSAAARAAASPPRQQSTGSSPL
jgi:glycosyltransferase involved in cell wall biosynthesis